MSMTAPEATSLKLMTFRVRGQEFGVDIMAVREIRAWSPPMPLPHMPEQVKGVINLRGMVLPIIDLSTQLGWTPVNATPTHVVIVLSVGGEMQGMIVDSVSDILTTASTDLRPVPNAESVPGQNIIRGLITTDRHMITVLDLDQMPLHADGLELAA